MAKHPNLTSFASTLWQNIRIGTVSGPKVLSFGTESPQLRDRKSSASGCGHCPRKIVPQWVKVDRYFHPASFLQYTTLFLAKSDFSDRNPALRGQKTTDFCPRRSQFLSEKSQMCEKRARYCKNGTVNIRFSVLSRNVRVSYGKHRNPRFFPGKTRPSWWRFTSKPPPPVVPAEHLCYKDQYAPTGSLQRRCRKVPWASSQTHARRPPGTAKVVKV